MSPLDALLIVVAIYAILHLRRTPLRLFGLRQPLPPPKPRKAPSWLETLQLSGVYWAVEIHHDEGVPCCQKSREIAGQCIPIAEAPRLPLKDCDCMPCRCSYRPMLNQRSGPPRRMTPDRRYHLRYEPHRPARRKLRDRRQSGRVWEAATDSDRD